MRQNIYLSNISLNEAIDIFLEKIKDFKLGREYVKTYGANGRVTAKPIFAKISSPFYSCSAVDGIATVAKRHLLQQTKIL